MVSSFTKSDGFSGFGIHDGFCGWYNANRDVGGTEEIRNAAGPGETAVRVIFVVRYTAVTVYFYLGTGSSGAGRRYRW